MKTKEEVLDEIFFKAEVADWYKPVLKAMEQYATQFKQNDVNPPVMQAEGSDVSEGSTVGQRSGDTVAAGRTCDKYCTGPWDCKCQDVLAAFYRKDAGSSHEGQP